MRRLFLENLEYDSDGDGISDFWERVIGSNPHVADKDAINGATGKTNLQRYEEEVAKAGTLFSLNAFQNFGGVPSENPENDEDGVSVRPFYAVVDLGVLPRQEGYSFDAQTLLISEKNAWVATDDFHRWHEGTWTRMPNSERLVIPCYISVRDIGNDGTVLVNTRPGHYYCNGDDLTQLGVASAFYWKNYAGIIAAPSVGLGGIDYLSSWGLKILGESEPTAYSRAAESAEWLLTVARTYRGHSNGISFTVARPRNAILGNFVFQGTDGMRLWNADDVNADVLLNATPTPCCSEAKIQYIPFWDKVLQDFPISINRNGTFLVSQISHDDNHPPVQGSFLVRRGDYPRKYARYACALHYPEIDYSQLLEAAASTTFLNYNLICVNNEEVLVGSNRTTGAPVVVSNVKGEANKENILPPASKTHWQNDTDEAFYEEDGKKFYNVFPQFINAPVGMRARYYTIAGASHVWWRKVSGSSDELPARLEFAPPAHISDLVAIGNNAKTDDEPEDDTWERRKWCITALNDDGLLAAKGKKRVNGINEEHGTLLIPANMLRLVPTLEKDFWGKEKMVGAKIKRDRIFSELNDPYFKKAIEQNDELYFYKTEPLTLRLTVINGWENNPNVKIRVGEKNFYLKVFEFEDVVTKKIEKFLYPVANMSDKYPQCFIPSSMEIPEKFKAHGYVSGSKRFNIKIVVGNNENIAATFRELEVFLPDANRDGEINDADKGLISNANPWRFWRNDDDDTGDVGILYMGGFANISERDIPVPKSNANGRLRDGMNGSVDGRCDFIDFFPVWLDLKILLRRFPPSEYDYRLKQEDGNVNVVFTPFLKSHALEYQRTDMNTLGYNLTRLLHDAKTTQVTKKGIVFDWKMPIAENDGLLILVEGRDKTQKPLTLEIKRGKVAVFRAELPMNISSIEEMYRWINLRPILNQTAIVETDTSEPINWPDSKTNGKQFVFVHGFNSNERDARGWASEAFKRLYWSGSMAMFTMVTWRSNREVANYWLNVENAFLSAQAMAQAVNALPGNEKILAAHSLGNMIASTAINDYGLNASKFFMLGAAVPLEAYDSAEPEDALMIPDAWNGYSEDLRPTTWWRLFPENDARSRLTWQNRFSNVPRNTEVFNFYSSADELCENSNGDAVSPLERPWVYQEMNKGGNIQLGFRNNVGTMLGIAIIDNFVRTETIRGGWGFNNFWMERRFVTLTRRTPAEIETAIATIVAESSGTLTRNSVLTTNPFFAPYSDGGQAINNTQKAVLFAWEIPATTKAMGRNPVKNTQNGQIISYDMNRPSFRSGWPQERLTNKKYFDSYLHSDPRDVAYFFTFPLYDKWVELAELKTEGNQP
ncbi:MAG: thrombospondin type 3 repeat-containing protein [Puniceicoccales bacterium]|jgi:pimeloyl-ACP methyl ester carboxylesterase|nr:thrombospondin type 3 repeat-containing protein [Puniceicoccales bacterium]